MMGTLASSFALVAAITHAGDPPAVCFHATHSCLTEGEAGCSDAVCCDAVCSIDPFCCSVEWDGICVGEAVKFCAITGECGASSHPCDVTGFPACSDAVCCEAVCAVLPECCEALWDSDCVLQAFALCRLPDPPTVCTTATHGCSELGGPGCSADGCCADVCAVSPTCCAVAWDAACVTTATELCGIITPPFCDPSAPPNAVVEPEPCGTSVNTGCNGGADSGSDCCVPSGGVDCDDPACVDAVCGIDPFCCMVAWDQICADESIVLCPETCGIANPQTTPIAIGVPVCGYVHTSPTSDYDWYALTLTEKTEVVVTLTSTKPLTFGIGDADGVMDCSLAAELDPAANSAPLVPKTIDACLEPGTHWIIVRPAVSTGVVTCSGGGEYLLEVALGAPTCDLPDPVNDICAAAVDIFEGRRRSARTTRQPNQVQRRRHVVVAPPTIQSPAMSGSASSPRATARFASTPAGRATSPRDSSPTPGRATTSSSLPAPNTRRSARSATRASPSRSWPARATTSSSEEALRWPKATRPSRSATPVATPCTSRPCSFRIRHTTRRRRRV